MESVHVRAATPDDLPAIRALIPLSVRALSPGFYTPRQIESAIRHVFGPDTQLIADGTYFVAERGGVLAGCGGWSMRRTLYGGDQAKEGEDPRLDPATEDRKSTRLNSSHSQISYAVFCLKKKTQKSSSARRAWRPRSSGRARPRPAATFPWPAART